MNSPDQNDKGNHDKGNHDNLSPYATGPNAANESGNQEYYGEMLDGLPFGMLVNGLSQQVPRWLAIGITSYFRVKKWFGRSPLPTSGFGPVGSSRIVSREEMPSRAMSRWAGKLEQLADLGFEPLVCNIPDLIGAKEAAGMLLIDASGSTFASLEWFRMPGADGIEEQCPIEFNSIIAYPTSRGTMREGRVTELMTALVDPAHLAFSEAFRLDYIDTQFLPNSVSMNNALEEHRKRLTKYPAASIARAVAMDEYQELTKRRLNAMIERGLVRQLSDKEIRVVRQNRLEP